MDGLLDRLTAAQRDAADALNQLRQARGQHGGGRFDLSRLIRNPQAIDALAQMRNLTKYGDLNGDGVIDSRDLPAVLSALDGANVNDLPPALRASLLGAIDANHDGQLDDRDLLPVILAFGQTPTGRDVLAAIDTNHDGRYSPDELLNAYSAIVELASSRMPRNGHLDLSQLPPAVRAVMLDRLDTDRDGFLTPNDISGFEESLLRPASTDNLDPRSIQPIVDRLRRTPQGTAVLDAIDTNHDGQYSPSELLHSYDAIVDLADSRTPRSAPLDLSKLPPNVRDALLSNLDSDGDGQLTPNDLSGLRDSIVHDPPSPPSPPPAPLPSPPRSPSGGSGGGGGGAAVGWIIAVLAVVLLGWGAFRYRLRRKRNLDTRRMLDPPTSSTTPYVSNYTAPIPMPHGSAAMGGATGGLPFSPGEAACAAGETRNVDAIARARAANGSAC